MTFEKNCETQRLRDGNLVMNTHPPPLTLYFEWKRHTCTSESLPESLLRRSWNLCDDAWQMKHPASLVAAKGSALNERDRSLRDQENQKLLPWHIGLNNLRRVVGAVEHSQLWIRFFPGWFKSWFSTLTVLDPCDMFLLCVVCGY